MTSFCRSFIDDFTNLAAPLYTLLQKETLFDWNSNCETSFQKLKMAMTSAPVLAHPDTSKPYIMYTDASNVGIGASLHQKQPDGSVRPIAYASRKLLPAERNYCASDKEALAVVYGFNKFHHYVHGSCTELHTDHRALITALKNEDPRGRIARWNSALQAYDFEIKHVKGLDNGLTDALSRDFDDENINSKLLMPITRSQGPPTRTIRRPGKLDILADDSSDSSDSTSNIVYRNTVNDELENDDYDFESEDQDEHLNSNFEISDISEETPSQNNFNFSEFLPSSTHFRKMQHIDPNCKAITNVLNNPSSASKHAITHATTVRACISGESLSEPFEMVSIDHAGPFPTTERDAVAVPTASTETTIKALEKRLIVPHGCVHKILSDNGTAFTSQQMQMFCYKYGIKQVLSSPYHPETNGMTERFNRTLKSMIKAYCTDDQANWDEYLDMHVLAYRTAKHETLGISPFEALYGRQPRLPANSLKPTNPNIPINVLSYERKLEAKLKPIRVTINNNNEIAKDAMRLRYNARHRATKYEIGDYILLKRQTADGL
ncbi:Transposon Tf2-6 polyprotein, partial [Smittium culicis]